MTEFIVVGVGGVGMAHVCAIGRTGNRVKAIVDIDKNILERSQHKWENNWLDLVESTPVQSNCKYYLSVTDIDVLTLKNDDVFIVATPPDTHLYITDWILLNTKCSLILEKPYMLPKTYRGNKRIIPSCEWVFHSKLNRYLQNHEIYSIGMRYPASHKTNWEQDTLFDFCPHLFSILAITGDVVIKDKVNKVYGGQDKFAIVVETANKPILLWGDRRNTRCGLYINDELFEWENDLFDLQIQNFDKIKIHWPILLGLENQLGVR